MAIPFFTLTMSIIELGIMFSAASLLEGATGSASRLIRTGQIQQSTSDPTAQQEIFMEALCNAAPVLINCAEIDLEVLNIGSFGSFDSFQAQRDLDGNIQSQGFDAGGVSNVILIRVGYRYQLMTPLIGSLLGQNGTGTQYFISTIVLQTEPYEFQGEGV